MLQQESDFKEKIVAVLLCAGEGLRLKGITTKIPKPLLKIKSLHDLSILEHNILNLIKLGIKRIYIITGHLGEKIDEFITSFKKINRDFNERLFVIDSEGQYKRGPLYSLLSLTSIKSLFKKEYVYTVMPGDTIFEFNLLSQIITFLLNNTEIFQKNPVFFYRKILVTDLKKIQVPETISIADIKKKTPQNIIKKLKKLYLSSLSNSDSIRQLFPISSFPYGFLTEILDYVENLNVNTISEVINDMIIKGYNFIAVKLSNEYQFYDIDTTSDINSFKGFLKK